MKRFLMHFFIHILGCVLIIPLWSRENYIRFERISSEQGLTQSVVHSILQDSKGFMWFGTQGGVSRFDGYRFKEFKYNPKDPHSLPVNRVIVIHEDQSGVLWIGTDGGGLTRFNPEQENFSRFPYINPEDPKPSSGLNLVRVIHEDKKGILWLGTEGGMLRFDPKSGKWKRFDLKSNIVLDICQDRSGLLWIGTRGGGLKAFDPENNTYLHYTHNPDDPGSLSSNEVDVVFEDRSGRLWVGTTRGLDRFDRRRERFIHYRHVAGEPDSLSHNWIKTLMEDASGQLWIGTRGGGLNRVKSIEKGTFVHYKNDPFNPNSLANDKVFDIYEDRGGSIWIGTYGGGISRIDWQKQTFGHFLSPPEAPNSMSSNDISAICQDKGGLMWFGSYDKGLNVYNPSTDKITSYQFRKNDPGSLSGNEVLAIYEDYMGTIWIGNFSGGGINRFNRETGTFTRYRNIPGTNKGPSSNFIFCIGEDQDNQLWIGTYTGGLNRFTRETESFEYYRPVPGSENSIGGDSVTVICPDRLNKKWLWVGTYNSGLDCLDRETGIFQHYIHHHDNRNSLSHDTVRSLYISPGEPAVLWVGTSDGGLNSYNIETRQWQAYTEADGLPNNTVYGILEDGEGNLWMSTNYGLSRFNPRDGSFTNYEVDDGLQANEFNQGAFHKTRDGRFYFGGGNGYNEFYPGKISRNSHEPPVVITAFNIINRKSPGIDKPLKKSILETKEIHLSYRDVFSFEFAALNYIATAKNRYKYKMEPRDEDWLLLGSKRDINFSQLTPGNYVLHVKASNNDGVWNEEGTSIRLIVHPPFYATWWFRVLMVLLLGGIILGIYKMRVRQYKIQRKRLEQQVAKRTAEIRNQKEIIEDKNVQLEISNKELQKSQENLIELNATIEEKNQQLEVSNEELKELNATKDKFFSIISHDLRNHLTTLMGTSDLLANSYSTLGEEKRLKYSRAVDKSANQLYELLENLLQWARSQTGVLKCKPRTIDLESIVPDTVSYFRIHTGKKKITLTSEIKGKSIAHADRDMVTSVLRNLISNAIKFTPKNGSVHVIVLGDDNEVMVSVIDSGVGISSDVSGNLFNIGMAHSTKGTANEKGTGLGLILCKEFIEKNNGRIWYEPAVEGGSIFRFTLPVRT